MILRNHTLFLLQELVVLTSFNFSISSYEIFNFQCLSLFNLSSFSEFFLQLCYYLDASDLESYAFKAGDCHLVSNYLFSPSESQMSSGARELLAIVKSFETFSEFFQSNSNSVIFWCTDSMCAYSYLKHGSRIPEIQKLLISIKELEYKHNLSIYPKWMSRSSDLLKTADYGSRMSNSSEEYGVSEYDLQSIQSRFNLSISLDAFASTSNHRAPRFISAIPQVGAIEVDFFLATLSSEDVIYAHPPVSLIQRTLNKILMYDNLCIILLIPFWPSHPFWKSFVNVNVFQWFIKDFWIFNPFYVSSSPKCMFSGYKNFPTLALHIKTNENHSLPIPSDLL